MENILTVSALPKQLAVWVLLLPREQVTFYNCLNSIDKLEPPCAINGGFVLKRPVKQGNMSLANKIFGY